MSTYGTEYQEETRLLSVWLRYSERKAVEARPLRHARSRILDEGGGAESYRRERGPEIERIDAAVASVTIDAGLNQTTATAAAGALAGRALPGVHVRNLEVGAGRLDSYFGDLNEQVPV